MLREIWWADLLRAGAALGIQSASEFAALARVLGFVERDSAAFDSPDSTARPAQQAGVDDEPAPEPSGPPATRRADASQRSKTSIAVLNPIGTELIEADLTAGPTLAIPMSGSHVLPHEPLLASHSAPAILAIVLSRHVDDGPLDQGRAIETLATGRPLAGLPRELRPTLRYGTQILVDLSDSMQPYRRDQFELLKMVRAVAGAAGTDVTFFVTCPTLGAGRGRRRRAWTNYRTPAAGTRVLLLTDFGIGGDHSLTPDRATTADWIAFFRLLRGGGCEPIALVPYTASRRPARLRAWCQMLTWDRHVTVGHARTATR